MLHLLLHVKASESINGLRREQSAASGFIYLAGREKCGYSFALPHLFKDPDASALRVAAFKSCLGSS
jgi:hypothetical protein